VTTVASRGVRIGPEGLPEHTLGWDVLAWTAEYLLQPDGPRAGSPWRFTDEQARFVLWWYAVDADGRFVFRRGMFRRMKGHGKDPVGAALACVELAGPCRFAGWRDGKPEADAVYSAWIQTAAVSKDQTRNTMTLFPGMLSPLAQREYDIDIGKEIIYANRGRCRIEAVTSSPRALEGGRPTFTLKNETHHWLTANEGLQMAEVIARNAAKTGNRVLAISNAHNPGEGSDAERDYDAWLKMAAGQSRAMGFLYDSLEAPPDIELADRDSLLEGILAARGDSVWLDPERLIEEIYDPQTAPSTSRRFYLNQIIAAEDAWLTPQEWDACAAPDKHVDYGELITLGLDGSKSNDHTVLMGCRVEDSHMFPLGVWDPERYDGTIPTDLVDAAVVKAFSDYDVVGIYSDVHEWESYTDKWEQEFGDQLCARSTERHPVKWDMRRQKETTLAAEAYRSAIIEGDLTQSGDKRIDQYHYNARRRPNVYGVTFSKESPFSSRKVDGVAAGMLARKARQDYMALPEAKQRQKKKYARVYWA
jgi:hypothetical protein